MTALRGKLRTHPRFAAQFRRVPRDYLALKAWADAVLTRSNRASPLERAAAFEVHAIDAYLRGDRTHELHWMATSIAELAERAG